MITHAAWAPSCGRSIGITAAATAAVEGDSDGDGDAAAVADAVATIVPSLLDAPTPQPMSSKVLHDSVVVADAMSIVVYTPLTKTKGVFRRFALDSGLLSEECVVSRSEWGLGVAAAACAGGSGAMYGMCFPGATSCVTLITS